MKKFSYILQNGELTKVQLNLVEDTNILSNCENVVSAEIIEIKEIKDILIAEF